MLAGRIPDVKLRQLRQQLRADGQQIAASKRRDLADVAKRRTHDFGLDAMFFVVVKNRLHRLHAGVVRTRLGRLVPRGAGGFFVPVVNAAHKRRDQLHFGLATGHGLAEREEQRQIAANAFTLEFGRGLDALPGRGDFDQHTLAGNALRLVERHDAPRPGHRGGGVKAQAGIDFGGHAAGNGVQNLGAKAHQQMVHHHVQRLAAVRLHGFGQQGGIFGFLHRLQDQRRVGGGVLRLELGQLLEVTGIGHHRGELLEGVELVHRVFALSCVVSFNAWG